MSDEFYEKIDEIEKLNNDELIEAMKKQDNITNYYRLLIKEEKITVQLRTTKGKYIPYDINTKDPLILLRFYHQARNSELTKPGDWDKMELYLIKKNGNVIKKVEPTATIASLTNDMPLAEDDPQLYFSFKLPERVAQAITKIQAQVRGKAVRNRGKKNDNEDPNGDCKGKNRKCGEVDERIKIKKMSNIGRQAICKSYANCDWIKKAGRKKKKKKKKKKAFLSRKKNNRKNRTKKKTLSK